MNAILERIFHAYQLQTKRTSKGDTRLYIKLYKAIKHAIDSVDIPRESYLPSTRMLAEHLKNSRSTVLKTYELLVLEGYLESKPGAGYLVIKESSPLLKKISLAEPDKYPEISDRGKAFLENVKLINTIDDKAVAFRPGIPPLDIFPVNQWKNLSNLYWRHIKSSALTYSAASGNQKLKKNIANYLNLTRGIKCESEQVMIVSGSLQSLYLIGSVILNPTDQVVLENPTFPNVHSIFKSLRAAIEGVPVDEDGLKVSKIKSRNAKLIHTTPSGHYPSSVMFSMQRRKELLSWASEHKSYIIENEYEHEVSNYNNHLPSLFELDEENRTIFMGTFNRLLHPSVRIGYVVLPHPLIQPVEALLNHSHRFVPPSIQIVLNQFIEKKYLFAHIKNVIQTADTRKKEFIELFEENFSSEMTLVNKNQNSLHLLATFNSNKNQEKVIALLAKRNILIHSYSKCFIGSEKKEGLILGYSSVKLPLMKAKLQVMEEVFKTIK